MNITRLLSRLRRPRRRASGGILARHEAAIARTTPAQDRAALPPQPPQG